jgi:hypothetical protein
MDQAPPDGFEIVWESRPAVTVRKPTGLKWEKYLQPVKAAPGSEARIFRCETRKRADARVRQIKNRLLKADPMGRWEFKVSAMQDKEGGYGIWATYRGQMTAQQHLEQELKRRAHSEKMKAHWEKRRIKQQLQEDLSNVRPFPGGRW